MISPAGFTVGVILIAVGAILVWGITEDANGINIDAVGWILMIVGAVAALLSLIFWSGAMRGRPGYRRREYVEGDPYPPRRGRRTVVEEDDPGPPPAY